MFLSEGKWSNLETTVIHEICLQEQEIEVISKVTPNHHSALSLYQRMSFSEAKQVTRLEVNSEPLNEILNFPKNIIVNSIREQYNSIVGNTIIITVLVYIKSSFQLPFHLFIACN